MHRALRTLHRKPFRLPHRMLLIQYARAQFASLPASIPLELPNKRKKPSSSSSSSSSQLYIYPTLQRKLRKRERAKAQSSRKKDKGRTKPRHRSRDKQSPGMPAKKKGQRQQWERSSSRRRHQICNQAGPQAPPIPVDL